MTPLLKKLMKNAPRYKCRASSASMLTNTDSKTFYRHLMDYIYPTEWSTLQTQKGLAVEDQILALIGCTKNTVRFEDECFTGTPDAFLDDMIVDVKASYTRLSFLQTKKLKKAYFYQMQVYMHLTGLKKARVYHVFVPTEEHLIDGEALELHKGPTSLKYFDTEYDENIINELKKTIYAIQNGQLEDSSDCI